MTLRSFMHVRFWLMPYHFKWFKHWSKRTKTYQRYDQLNMLEQTTNLKKIETHCNFFIGNLLAQQFFVVHFCCLMSVWYNAWAERYLFDTTLRHYLQDELDNCDTAPSKWYDLKLETTDFSLTIWVAPTLHEPGFPKPSDTAMIFH